MKNALLVIAVLLVIGCEKAEKSEGNKLTPEEKKVVGTYEAKVRREGTYTKVLLESGIIETSNNILGKGPSGRWRITYYI